MENEPTQTPLENTPPPAPESPQPLIVPQPPAKKRSYKKLLIVLTLLLVAGGAAAVWFFVLKKDPAQTATTNTSQTTVPEKVTPKLPVNIVYSHRDAFGAALHLYARPAAGGNRTDAKTLDTDDFVSARDVHGKYVAVAINNGVFMSSNNGASFEPIYSGKTSSQIVSLKFSADGSRLAVADLPAPGDRNSVLSMNLKGEDSKELFKATTDGAYIEAWDTAKQLMIVTESCYNCDGRGTAVPKIRDLTKNTSSTFAELAAYEFYKLEASPDFSKIIYVKITPHKDIKSTAEDLGPGYYIGAPYTIFSYDVASKQSTKLVELGTDADVTAQAYFLIEAGFAADGSTPYYSIGKNLYTIEDGKPELLYEAAQNIWKVDYVSNETVIAEIEQPAKAGEFTVINYSVVSKTAMEIIQATVDTAIFGVTVE